jgi:hypothetical protein
MAVAQPDYQQIARGYILSFYGKYFLQKFNLISSATIKQ